MLYCGIIGLPLCGKTTVFNVITRAGAEVKPYSGGKTDPNRAVVDVPDTRFDRLAAFYEPKKVTPAQVEFVDLAGLSKGAGKGEGLGNSFLTFAAESDALIHVVRCFQNAAVSHPEGSINPSRDWEIIEYELIFRDLAIVENRLGKLVGKKKLTPEETAEKTLLERCRDCLMDEKPLRELGLTAEEFRSLRGFTFLTEKKQIVVLNMDESGRETSQIPGCDELMGKLDEQGTTYVKLFGQLEMDLMELTPEEASEFTEGLPIEEPGRERLISLAYRVLGLISFFTCGPDEVRAWTLHDGDTAIDAAGAIHSDLARGFIRAQVVHYEDFEKYEFSFAKCRDSGLLRLEGKDYKVWDGDVIEIRFNV